MTQDSTNPESLEALAAREPPTTHWPKRLGILSLIYAIGGMTCQLGAGSGAFLQEWGLSMQGIDFDVPMAIKLQAVFLAGTLFLLGIYMLVGAVGLLRRSASGVKRLRRWAVARLVFVVIGLVLTAFTLPAQIDMQRAIQEATNKRMRESERPDLVGEFNEEKQWKIMLGATVGLTGVFCVYPFFLGFYLTRKKIIDEVKLWM